MSTTYQTTPRITTHTNDHPASPSAAEPFAFYLKGQRIDDWSWEPEAMAVASCATCGEWVIALRTGSWEHGYVQHGWNILTPDGSGFLVRDDEDVCPSDQEGDEAVRYCTTCSRARVGFFGEFSEYEPTTFSCPGTAEGTEWTCATCDTSVSCAFDTSL